MFNKYVVHNQIGLIKKSWFMNEQKIDRFDVENEKISKNKYHKKLHKNNLVSYNNSIVEKRLIGDNLSTMIGLYNTEFECNETLLS